MKLKEFMDKTEDLFDSTQLNDLFVLLNIHANAEGIEDKKIRESVLKLIEEKREILLNKEIEL